MCSCNQNPCTCCPPKKVSGIRGIFNKYAPRLCLAGIMCGAHGLHLAGVAAVMGSVASLGATFGLAVSAGILGGWYLWRGKKADKGERNFMLATTAVSVALSFAMDHGEGHHHHHTPVQPCPVPNGTDINQGAYAPAPEYISPGEAWFDKQDSSTKVMITNNAKWTGQNLEAYLDGLCVETAAPRATSPAMK